LLLFGGSRSGKTLILLFSIVARAMKAPGSRHAVFRFRNKHVREAVMLDSFPKMMGICFPGIKYKTHQQGGFIKLKNGSEIWFIGLDDKHRADKILGREFATVYFNECSEISYPAITTAMTRLAQKVKIHGTEALLPNKAYFDCNPPGKSHWSHKLFIRKVEPENNTPLLFPEKYDSMLMNPQGNRENLAEGYIEETLAELPERKRQRFLEGNWLDDMEGALWKREMIDRFRIINAPEFQRVVIGVDPAVTANPGSDETGIVVAGRDKKGEYYILNDATLKASPLEWARAVEREYRRWKADRVICETNNGGNLVIENLRNVCPDISCRSVSASRGKIVRAEPVAALYEQGKVHHVGSFRKLEDQLCSYDPALNQSSPDRLDAMVWALSELSAGSGECRAIMA
jgi:predicted phage terminase large subunit-like protein